jgi:hypothetical protein
MVTFHESFTQHERTRLKIAAMGLGLVRLLQKAGRTGEARTTLYSIENGGMQALAAESVRSNCNRRQKRGRRSARWQSRAAS